VAVGVAEGAGVKTGDSVGVAEGAAVGAPEEGFEVGQAAREKTVCKYQ